MIDKYINDRAVAVYLSAVDKVKKAAEEAAREIGLSGVNIGTIIKVASGDSPVPAAAIDSIKKSIINKIEIEMETDDSECSAIPGRQKKQENEAGTVLYTLEQLKNMTAAEVKQLASFKGLKPEKTVKLNIELILESQKK